MNPTGPFIHSGITTRWILRQTLLAMAPVTLTVVAMEPRHFALSLFATLLSILFFHQIRHDEEPWESLGVVGIIAFLLTPGGSPFYLAPTLFLLALALREAQGGIGKNIFNPAVLSRVILMSLLPAFFLLPISTNDGVTGATPLAKIQLKSFPMDDQTLPFRSGPTPGEKFPLLVLAGGIFLVWRKIIDGGIPLAFLAGITFFALILPPGSQSLAHAPHLLANPLTHLWSGGTLVTAFFLLTDPVTHSLFRWNRYLLAFGSAGFTLVIRLFTPYPDGCLFAVLLANLLTPLLENFTRHRGEMWQKIVIPTSSSNGTCGSMQPSSQTKSTDHNFR